MKSLLSGTILTLFLTNICFAQWFWQNPLPQGNSLTNIFVIDSAHAWATGYDGSLIYTADGSTWKLYEDIDMEENLGGIFFISSQVGWFVTLSSDKVFKTIDGGDNWELLGPLGFNLEQIYFFDESNGIVSGDGHIARTTNGGASWQNVYELAGLIFRYISCPEGQNIWVSTSTNKIFYSSNAGNTWEMQSTGENDVIASMQFSSDSIGWLAVHRGNIYTGEDYILKSTNGGVNWNLLSFDSQGPIKNIFFLNDSIGWINNDIYGRLYKTDDAGSTFTLISNRPLNSMWFDKNQNGWGADAQGRIYFTPDGGYNWSKMTNGIHEIISGLSFINQYRGFAVAIGYILRTTNGGTAWENAVSDGTYWFYDIDFYDSLNGIAVGWCDEWFNCSGGVIFKTTDGGDFWSNVYPHGYLEIDGFSSSLFLSRETIYIGGTFYILKTTNDGNSWDEYYLGYEGISDIFFLDSLTGWAGGGSIYKTIDGGDYWEMISDESAENLFFLNQNVGFITSYGKFKRSDNGGISWQDTGYPGDDIMFTDSLRGWLLGDNSLYKTTNGGDSWEFMTDAPTNFHMEKLWAEDNKHFWIAGENGIILKYNDSTISGVQEAVFQNSQYFLAQNYPNPFNPTTKIKYRLPELSKVKLTIYDVLGREVKTLINEEKPAGTYELTWNASNLPSGVYFYQIKAGSFIQTKKMILLR